MNVCYAQLCGSGERDRSPLGVGVEIRPSNPEQSVSVRSHWQVKGSSIPMLFITKFLVY